MAERSFKKEVELLRKPAGHELHVEGILGVTKALLQSGVAYVGGYQGSPISHLMDVLNDARDLLEELGVHFESNGSEATAAAMLAASVNYPLRGAVAWKSTVGTNVASDALANLASGGVTGGALIVVGEDYGEGSSIMQERSHAFAMKSQMWLLDPRPNLPSITDAVSHGFELSEASNTPVMLQLRIRACHVHGSFVTKDNVRPVMTVGQAKENPVRDTDRIVLPPANFLHEKEKVERRLPKAQAFIKEHKLNEFFAGEDSSIGLIVPGGLYNSTIRALNILGLANAFGDCRFPIYVMNVAYPYIDDEIIEFCVGKTAVLMIEEGQPNYIEQAVGYILRTADVQTPVYGKNVLPSFGEYDSGAIKAGLEKFLAAVEAQPGVSAQESNAIDPWRGLPGDQGNSTSAVGVFNPATDYAPAGNGAEAGAQLIPVKQLPVDVPPRPAGFCVGCPERPIFSAMKQVQKELGDLHVSCDIGCHLFSILPPFNIGNSTMGYGLGAAGGSAFNVSGHKRSISVLGDGGFWHNGLTSGIANAVFNRSDEVVIIVDNNYSAATGGQDILSSHAELEHRSTNHAIESAVKGVGVDWVKTVDTYDVGTVKRTLAEAMTTDKPGPKVIVARNECMLNKQRREKAATKQKLKLGQRVERERFYVDGHTCTGDHACVRLSGCPSLTITDNPNPLKEDPVAYVDNDCVGCGLCGENAHTAVLCPSFTKTVIVSNPTRWDQWLAGLRQKVIGFLQNRHERSLVFGEL
ncbi:indolepyruvate ferredoxin oxidoreductase subunit alpha [Halioxenophilus aromaticivorans]|uniref:Indolepyruvate ferredoxin oxidoreductase subunit alpha n=1 Tax=Halioxenophilus aromaticivorans TaxID=1306992 RepID=A0AAV3TYK6_9ALTE